MIEVTLAELAEWTSGELRLHGSDAPDTRVCGALQTDSRVVSEGDLFVAKPGEITDGHLFVPKAIECGAALCIVERFLDEAPVSQLSLIHI